MEYSGLNENEGELDSLRRSCRLAMDRSEQARLALAPHEANHFCDREDFKATAVGPTPASVRTR